MKKALLVVAATLVLASCSSLSSRDAKSSQANTNLGGQYMMQGQYELALEKLNRALSQDPDYPLTHHYMAELYKRIGEAEKADEHFRKAISLDEKDSSIRNNYGVFLCGQKRFKESEQQFLAALKNPVYGGRTQTLENLGMCMQADGNAAKAQEYYRKALDTESRAPKALLGMAELSHQAGNQLSARAYLQRYAEVGPHTPQSLWLGVRIEKAMNNKGTAGSYGLLLKNNFPNSEEAALYLRSEKP